MLLKYVCFRQMEVWRRLASPPFHWIWRGGFGPLLTRHEQPFPCSPPQLPVSREQTNRSLFSPFISCVAEIMPLSPHNDRVGFYNEGNSCFVNAATQVWLQGLACCIVPSPPSGSSVVSAEGQVRTASEGWRMAFTLGHSQGFLAVYPCHDRGGVLPDQRDSHFHCLRAGRAFIRCGISLRRIAT